MFKQDIFKKNFHYWHIVTVSPWPFMLSMFILPIPLGLVNYFQGYYDGLTMFYLGIILVSFVLFFWFRDIIIESTYEGYHTKEIKNNIYISFSWFIFSEVMLFVAFFWAYCYLSWFPSIELGLRWPPIGFKDLLILPMDIPLLNTLLLLLSGATLTLSHYTLRLFNIPFSLLALFWTIFLASLFIFFQGFEYYNSGFDISDSVYGSTFFLCTGLHGFHVIVGNTALIITTLRMYLGHFSRDHHVGFELSAWYWHFVDVVWLFLYIIIYYLGSNIEHQIIAGFNELVSLNLDTEISDSDDTKKNLFVSGVRNDQFANLFEITNKKKKTNIYTIYTWC